MEKPLSSFAGLLGEKPSPAGAGVVGWSSELAGGGVEDLARETVLEEPVGDAVVPHLLRGPLRAQEMPQGLRGDVAVTSQGVWVSTPSRRSQVV